MVVCAGGTVICPADVVRREEVTAPRPGAMYTYLYHNPCQLWLYSAQHSHGQGSYQPVAGVEGSACSGARADTAVSASCCRACVQGYMSSSSTRSGTICRTSTRHSSILGRLEQQRQMEQQHGPSRSLADLLGQLEVRPSASLYKSHIRLVHSHTPGSFTSHTPGFPQATHLHTLHD